MKPQEMKFPAFLTYCKRHGRKILVRGRAPANGKWSNLKFGLLDPQEQLRVAKDWYDRNSDPCKLKREV